MNNKNNNIIKNNPVLVGGLGFVSILAATTTLKAALIMSAAVLAVLILSSLVTSILKNFIPRKLEDLTLLIIIGGFAITATMLIKFYYPITESTMRLAASLIAVNSVVFYNLKDAVLHEPLGQSIKTSFFAGLAYGLVAILMGAIRELFAIGTIYGFRIIPEKYTIPTFSSPVFGFILLGLLIALGSYFANAKKEDQ
ncbi:Rnf-Nqr domain containing protein [uncultured Helcococcus sp.]|uniref:Rnf-Nqr domain containing protein n=1 Tax=uncultured Helcococcus sp. TaxID=1072508 RepID=UPI0028894CF3|nr:Rnf-Nqr domain containing protein [uncultured Helcococcus sp.]